MKIGRNPNLYLSGPPQGYLRTIIMFELALASHVHDSPVRHARTDGSHMSLSVKFDRRLAFSQASSRVRKSRAPQRPAAKASRRPCLDSEIGLRELPPPHFLIDSILQFAAWRSIEGPSAKLVER